MQLHPPVSAFLIGIIGIALTADPSFKAESAEGSVQKSSTNAELECSHSQQPKGINGLIGLPLEPRRRSENLRCELNKLLPLPAEQQRYLIQSGIQPGFVPPGLLELRAGITVFDSCNVFGSDGRLKPDARVQSRGYQFWSVQLASGHAKGLRGVTFFQSLKLCPDQPKMERNVWLPESPVVASQQGKSLVVDLPEGWTLQWRSAGQEAWATAVPFR